MRGRRFPTTTALLMSLAIAACGPEGQTEETEQPGGASDDAGAVTGGPTTEGPIPATGEIGGTGGDTTGSGTGAAGAMGGDTTRPRR